MLLWCLLGTSVFPSQLPFGLAPVTMGCLEERLTLSLGHWPLSGPWAHQPGLHLFPAAGGLAACARGQLWYGTAVTWDQTAGEQVSGYHSASSQDLQREENLAFASGKLGTSSVSGCKTWTIFSSNQCKNICHLRYPISLSEQIASS